MDGRMVYDFYREGSDKKAVIFHPSFDGHVIFNHLRMGEHNSTEVSTPVADTVAGEKCVPSKVCFGDSDCNGGSCLGIAVGKCSCGACVSLLSCKDDSACGGLIGACNNETSLCDCELGFKTHTIGSFFDALVSVCNVRDCVPNTDSCFGLPCNSGICACF
ncbi:unnamed protein product [Toxocara canis]|uniref:Chondroitin proteoglycan 3 n=1 Tax=Toxocara canis TaxID=6265 RepID=A0A3P7INC3_TOXCA|nr:unnamed protein product [Toxocara canis]